MASDGHLSDGDAPRGTDSQSVDGPGAVTQGEAYIARVEQYDDAADECTIYPADATEAELSTTWITADRDSFVSLDVMR